MLPSRGRHPQVAVAVLPPDGLPPPEEGHPHGIGKVPTPDVKAPPEEERPHEAVGVPKTCDEDKMHLGLVLV